MNTRRIDLRKFDLGWIFLGLLLIALIFSGSTFFRMRNLTSVLRLAAILGFATIGETLVLLVKGIDISVGAVMGIASMFIAVLVPVIGVPLAIVAALLVCLLIGVVKSLLIVSFRIPAIVTTMGVMWFIRGMAGVFSNGKLIRVESDAFNRIASLSIFSAIPVFFIVVFIIGGLLFFFLKNTAVGKHLYAVGGNEEAAFYSGINVQRIRFVVYIIATVLFGIAGILMSSYVRAGMPMLAEGYEFRAITAASLAGVSLSGGKGNLLKALSGAVILIMIFNLITSLGISPYLHGILEGSILIGAVWLCQRN